MKFCVNCGCKLNDDDVFCPECGQKAAPAPAAAPVVEPAPAPTPVMPEIPAAQEVSETPEGEPKKKSKKGLIIAGAAVLAVIIAAVIALLIILNSPYAKVGKALSNTAKKVGDITLIDTGKKVLQGGSVEIYGDFNGWNEMDLDATTDLKIYTNLKAPAFTATLRVDYKQQPVVDGIVAINKNDIAVNFPAILGQAYGIPLNDLKTDLPKSVLGEYIDDDDIDMIVDFVEELRNPSSASSFQKIPDVAEDYLKFVLKTASKECRIEKDKASVSVAGSNVKTSAYTYYFDDETMAAILKEFKDYFRKDKSTQQLLCDILVASNKIIDSRYDLSDARDELDDAMDELDDLIEEYEDEYYDTDARVTFYIAGGQLVALDLTDKQFDEKYSIVLGRDLSKPEEISYTYKSDYATEEYKFVVTENTSKSYSAKLSVKQAYGSDSEIRIDYDKLTAGYTVKIDTGYDNIKISGMFKKTGDTIVASVDKYSGEYEKFDMPKNVFTIKLQDNAPGVGRYTSIFEMSERDFEKLADDVLNNLMDLQELFQGYAYDLY